MPQIILKEKTAHLASYTFFTRDVDQYKNMSLSQLYQPPRTPFPQNTYHYNNNNNNNNNIYIYKKKPYLTLVLQKYNMVKIHSLS